MGSRRVVVAYGLRYEISIKRSGEKRREDLLRKRLPHARSISEQSHPL